MALFRFPERDAWPSVEDAPEPDACVYCDAMPDEKHHQTCPLRGPDVDADEIEFCDSCGCSYVTCCQCDEGDDL